jgi:hypothetical protein
MLSLVHLPAELLCIISSFLSTRDVVLVSHTCSCLYEVFAVVRRSRQDIDCRLRYFVPDPCEFRHLMRLTQAAIVGDFALALFTESSVPRRLDISLVDSTLTCGTRQWAWFQFLSGLAKTGQPSIIPSHYSDDTVGEST